MESFKKVISLNQAAKFSGYSQDYLGFLIRNGEIKGMKKGRVWFTTEENIKNYIFKKKVSRNKFALKDFFSFTRTRNIIMITLFVLIGGYLVLVGLSKDIEISATGIESAVVSDGGALEIKN
jgi:hypothetical protein